MLNELRDIQYHRANRKFTLGISAQQTRVNFFDGWEEAKAAGPEAVEKWLNTPITREEAVAFAELVRESL